MGHYDEFLIVNNSSHKIEYRAINLNTTNTLVGDSLLILAPTKSKFYCLDRRFKGGGEDKEDYAIYPPMIFADSIIVCYDDTICITHALNNTITIPENNFLYGTSWTTNSLGDRQLKHTFTFTDKDYQEAFDNQ